MMSLYEAKARLAPTVLAAPPVLLFFNALADAKAEQWLDNGLMVVLFGKGAAIAALSYLMMQANRLIGLSLFQRWLSKDELDFPTTRWLVAGNTELSSQYRQCIDQKLKQDFNLGLLPASMGDTPEVRRHNADLVGMVRQFVGSPPKLLQHNIEYGFFRNLIGAGIPVLLAGLGNAYLYSNEMLPEWGYQLSVIYAILAGILVCSARPIIGQLGIQYARVLFQEYMDIKKVG